MTTPGPLSLPVPGQPDWGDILNAALLQINDEYSFVVEDRTVYGRINFGVDEDGVPYYDDEMVPPEDRVTYEIINGEIVLHDGNGVSGTMLTKSGADAYIAQTDLLKSSAANELFATKTELANRVILPRWLPGRYYDGSIGGANASAAAMTGGLITYTSFVINYPVVVDRIGIGVTAGAAGGCRLGLYNSVSGLPGTRLFDAGVVDTATAGGKEAVITQTLQPGSYWTAAHFEAAPTVLLGNVETMLTRGFSSLTATRQMTRAYQFVPFSSGLPATAAATADAVAQVVSIRLRAA